jgi:hypothetical protein
VDAPRVEAVASLAEALATSVALAPGGVVGQVAGDLLVVTGDLMHAARTANASITQPAGNAVLEVGSPDGRLGITGRWLLTGSCEMGGFYVPPEW